MSPTSYSVKYTLTVCCTHRTEPQKEAVAADHQVVWLLPRRPQSSKMDMDRASQQYEESQRGPESFVRCNFIESKETVSAFGRQRRMVTLTLKNTQYLNKPKERAVVLVFQAMNNMSLAPETEDVRVCCVCVCVWGEQNINEQASFFAWNGIGQFQ